jgi:hypothetical protein
MPNSGAKRLINYYKMFGFISYKKGKAIPLQAYGAQRFLGG